MTNNEILQYTVTEENSETRIDLFIKECNPELSRSLIQNQVSQGLVKINGQKATKSKQLVENGDVVTIEVPPKKEIDMTPIAQNISLDILFEDEDMLVINKPAGLVVHPGAGNADNTVVNALLHHYPECYLEEKWDEPERSGIVHRLDKDTSGLLVIAKNQESMKSLKAAFKEHNIDKFYLAIVHGKMPYTQGKIENLIARHPKIRNKRAVVEENGKPAISIYRVLSEEKLASLVRVKIETGRTHQIRVHMSHIHNPVVGDPLYGGVRKQIPDCPNKQMLHAWKLTIPHPKTGETISFVAPIPNTFIQQCEKLSLKLPI